MLAHRPRGPIGAGRVGHHVDMVQRAEPDTIHEERTDQRLDEGDHDRFAHYVDKTRLTEALVVGTPVIAPAPAFP